MPRRAGGWPAVLTAALAQAPESAAYGLMALAPLGPSKATAAMALALLGAAVANVVSAYFGGGSLVTAPRASLALLTAALLASLAGTLGTQAILAPWLLPALLVAGMVVAGLLQVLFGAIGIGALVKYTPHPVRVGLMSGVGLLLLVNVGPALLGQPLGGRWLAALQAPLPGALAVGLLSMAVTAWTARRATALPPVLAGLVSGTALHFGLQMLGVAAGPLAGAPQLDTPWPLAAWDDRASAVVLLEWPLWNTVAMFGLTVAVLGSLDTLLAIAVVDGRHRHGRDANGELRAQGWANLASALVGGLPNSPSVPRSLALAPVALGPRRKVMAHALATVGLLLLAPQLLGALPLGAIAGVLALQGLQTVDPWLWRTLNSVGPGRREQAYDGLQRRLLRDSWGVAMAVVLTSLTLGLATAVLVGAACAVLLFVRANMRQVVRREHFGDRRRSLKVRTPGAAAWLAAQGRRNVVLELQGALFFGTADALRARLQQMAAAADTVVLDLYQVRDIDATAARILLELAEDWSHRGLLLLGAEWPADDPRRRTVEAIASAHHLAPMRFAPDVDQALEAAEDRLLERRDTRTERHAALDLADTLLAEGLDAADLAVLRAVMSRRELSAGDYLFRTGDAADAVYVSLKGDIGIRLPGSDRRVASFAPGVMVGELGVLERGARSADAVAESALVVMHLPAAELHRLLAEHPQLAARLLHNMSLHLAGRLRSMTQELSAWVARTGDGQPLP